MPADVCILLLLLLSGQIAWPTVMEVHRVAQAAQGAVRGQVGADRALHISLIMWVLRRVVRGLSVRVAQERVLFATCRLHEGSNLCSLFD